jgi:hypothetical protein
MKSQSFMIQKSSDHNIERCDQTDVTIHDRNTNDNQSISNSSSASSRNRTSPDEESRTSKFGSTNVNDSNNHNSHQSKSNDNGIIFGKNETQHVKRLRILVGLVLLTATISIALTIYFYLSNAEQYDFTVSYASDTDRILDGMGMSIKSSLGAMRAFGTMIVANAKQSNQSFPFFTLSNFGIKASRLLT